MRHKILKITRKLHALETQRARLIRALTRDEPLLVGSLSLVDRTCGKPTCHCATKPGHPVLTLATRRDARRRCQVVRLDDVNEVRRRVVAYKNFKQVLGELAAIEQDEKALLRGLLEGRNVTYE